MTAQTIQAHPDGFVGVFDSGVGGISVLQHLVRELPHETFHYFGDSAHAPYGDRTPEEVCSLTRAVADNMVAQGAKALVIACNTATGAAAAALRRIRSSPCMTIPNWKACWPG